MLSQAAMPCFVFDIITDYTNWLWLLKIEKKIKETEETGDRTGGGFPEVAF